MPWDRSQPPDPKYQTKQHRDTLADYKRQLKRDGYLICAATVCLFDTRAITNPRGRERDGLTAGHADDGVGYDGPQHRACNVRDGAVRGNARSHGRDVTPRRWPL